LYEEHLRIPLIVHHPRSQAEATTSIRIRGIDLLPTLLSSIGHPVDAQLDGVDMLRRSKHDPVNVVAVYMTDEKERSLSILSGSRKLIQHCLPERSHELFDLGIDPLEQNDLAAMGQATSQILMKQLMSTVGGDPCAVAEAAVRGTLPTIGLDPESVQALEALGYVH
jgi:arylsulfatase A-like enzyme